MIRSIRFCLSCALLFLVLQGCSKSGPSASEQAVLQSRAFSLSPSTIDNYVAGVESSVDSIPAYDPYHALNLSAAIAVPIRDCTLPGLYEAEKQMAISAALADPTGHTVPVKFSYSFGKKHDVLAKYANERAILSQTHPGESFIPVGGRTTSIYKSGHYYYRANNTKVIEEYRTGQKCFFSTINIIENSGTYRPLGGLGDKYDFINIQDADVLAFSPYPAQYSTLEQRRAYLKHIVHYMYYGYCVLGRCSQENAFAGEYANRLFTEVPSREANGEPQIIKLYVADLRSEQMEYDIIKLSEDTTRGLEIDTSIKNILNTCEVHKNYYEVTKNLSLPKEVNGYTFNPIRGAAQLVHNILSHDVDGTMLSTQYTPIVLDFGRRGVRTSSQRWGTYFNMANLPPLLPTDGYDQLAHRTSWLGGEHVDYNKGPYLDDRVQLDIRLEAQDGFLVVPNSDGKVTSSTQMFGDQTLVNGTKYANGFLALRAFAGKTCDNEEYSPTDVYIGPWDQDLYENQLKIWTDKDRDGQVDEGEIKSLREMGVLAINTCHILHTQEYDLFGNGTQMRSAFLMNPPGQDLSSNIPEILQILTYGTGAEGESASFRLAIDLVFNVDTQNRCIK